MGAKIWGARVYVVSFLIAAVLVLFSFPANKAIAHSHTEREALITFAKNFIPILAKMRPLENKIDNRWERYLKAGYSEKRIREKIEKMPEYKKVALIERKLIKVLQPLCSNDKDYASMCYTDLWLAFDKQPPCNKLWQKRLSKREYKNNFYLCELTIIGAISECIADYGINGRFRR